MYRINKRIAQKLRISFLIEQIISWAHTRNYDQCRNCWILRDQKLWMDSPDPYLNLRLIKGATYYYNLEDYLINNFYAEVKGESISLHFNFKNKNVSEHLSRVFWPRFISLAFKNPTFGSAIQ